MNQPAMPGKVEADVISETMHATSPTRSSYL